MGLEQDIVDNSDVNCSVIVKLEVYSSSMIVAGITELW
jgi:hypothetical protein